MPPVLDRQLLERYTQSNDQQAFAELVRRHLNLVHASACRQAPHAADDITQAVFFLLARKAGTLPRNRPLAGWLCQATRFCCAKAVRSEARRRHHEQEAAAMVQPSTPDKTLENLLPLLDESLGRLSGGERDAVALRYLEGKSLAETGAELSITADAAAKRAGRGLEKLRAFFAKRGYIVPVAAVAGLLAAESAHAAPTALAAKVVVLGAHGAVVSAQTAAIAKGASAMMTWIKVKLAAAVIGAAVITGGAGAVVIQQSMAAPAQTPAVAPAPPVVAAQVMAALQPPAPIATVQPSVAPARTFPSRAATQVVTDLKAQHFVFISDPALASLSDDLQKFLTSAPEPTPAGADAILKSLHQYVPTYFPADDQENGYLEFPDRVGTLKWKLWLALNRQPLSPEETRRRAVQVQWLHDYINAVPEPDNVLRVRRMQAGQLRAEAIVQLDAYLSDPLDVGAEGLSDAAFADLKRELEPGGEWAERWAQWGELRPDGILVAVQVAVWRTLFTSHDDPTNGPWFTVKQFPLAGDVIGVPLDGGRMKLHLRSNSLFYGGGAFLRTPNGEDGGNVVDMASFRDRNWPADPAERERWFAEQQFGDLILSPSGDALLAVRGAQIAPLDVAGWLAADRVSDTELRATITQHGSTSTPIVDVPAQEQWMPVHGLEPIAPHFYVVQTAEKRLAVIRITQRFGVTSPGISYNVSVRTRPVAAPTSTTGPSKD